MSMEEYYIFKRMFTFAPYTYCFQCCLQQSKNFNCKQPTCHIGLIYKKGMACLFAGFIFKVVYSIWKEEKFRKLLVHDMGEGVKLSTLDELIAWAIQEHMEQGKYNNCMKAFLWFCGNIERAKP
ncbi:hypothetical protein BDR05DRAFT_951399 [Suillus weaverae]|nr:hypothetical protein BDR05DRAFT_951399 [Suillus weaverae]